MGKGLHRIPALWLPGCATLVKGKALFGPPLLICEKDNTHFIGMLGRVRDDWE